MRNLRLVQENFGSINDIQLKESEIPSPKNNEVLIEVFSIGVSFADVQHMKVIIKISQICHSWLA